MYPESHYIGWQCSNIHYYRFGKGGNWLFCLHGYGENGTSFTQIMDILGNDYTLIAIDFPFHGKTDWQEKGPLEITALIEIIDLIKNDQQPFSLLGYSMGGRVALCLTAIIPEKIKQIVVVAPDGLHKNKWQWLSTQTYVGNKLFALTMRNPGWIFWLMELAMKIGLFNKSIHKFVHHYLDNPAERKRLYQRWMNMSKFRVNKQKLRSAILQHKLPLHMLFGKYDRIIVTRHGIDFAKKTAPHVQVQEIEAGHLLLAKKYSGFITEHFLT